MTNWEKYQELRNEVQIAHEDAFHAIEDNWAKGLISREERQIALCEASRANRESQDAALEWYISVDLPIADELA